MDPKARIGSTLRGKWRIERMLGTGGFATVYAATHRAGKRVAIKVLHSALGASEEVRRRFMREAYAANAVEHPAVVGVSDDDVTDDGAPFLVMDLLEGETAEARRKGAGGKLDVASVLLLAEETLDGLAAAHAKGIVHRDLKPENLFVTTGGHIKILDFGIARFREPGDESTSTQTGLTMGSPAFMAPEQARGRWSEVDARTDVYSLGATMFVLLTGRLVHGKRNLNEALIEAATQPAPSIAKVAPELPEAVASVVDRALAFEKEARWPHAAAMREAVREARDALVSATGTLPLGAIAPVGPGALGGGAGAAPAGAPGPRGGERLSGADGNTAYSVAAIAESAPGSATATAPLPSTPGPRNTEMAPPGALPGAGIGSSAPIMASQGTTSSPITSSPVTTSAPNMPVERRAAGWRAPVLAGSAIVGLGIVAVLLWIFARPAADSMAASGAATQDLPATGGTGAPPSSAAVGAALSAEPAVTPASSTSAPSVSPSPGRSAVATSAPGAPAAPKPSATATAAPGPGAQSSATGASSAPASTGVGTPVRTAGSPTVAAPSKSAISPTSGGTPNRH